jgi:TatA/E family protein of Tat protein translocase
VLILTTFGLDGYVYEALRAGASGFMLKDAPPEEIAAAVRIVASGEGLLAPAVTRRVIEEFVRQPRPAASPPVRSRPSKGHRMLTSILQPTHLIIVLIVALLVLGPKRLPEAGRALGHGLKEFKSSVSGVHDDDAQDQLEVAPGSTGEASRGPERGTPPVVGALSTSAATRDWWTG